MELLDHTIKVRQMIETVVNRCLDANWKYTGSGAAALQLQHGISLLPDIFGMRDLDDERTVDYFVYQIYRLRNNIANRQWQANWLWNNMAIQKFQHQYMSADGKAGINYYINQWLGEHDLSRGKLLAMIAKPKPNPLRRMVYLPSEEPVKKRFLNTPEGLALCQSATTGWSPLSDTCNQCKNWIDCGKITAKKYPELMRFRKEEYGKKKR